MQHPTIPAHFAPVYTTQIRDLQQEIAALRCWSPSEAKDALIADREAMIEELEQILEFDEAVSTHHAEVIEIASPAEQMVEVATVLTSELPAVRWTATGASVIGIIATLQIVIVRAGRGWKGDLRTTVWSPCEGEVVVVLSAAEASSAAVVAQLLITAAAVRCEQVAA